VFENTGLVWFPIIAVNQRQDRPDQTLVCLGLVRKGRDVQVFADIGMELAYDLVSGQTRAKRLFAFLFVLVL
jgi:hypothetical protein